MIFNVSGKKILFLDICKTAGTSVGETFNDTWGAGKGPKHSGFSERAHSTVCDGPFDYIFTIVRNPYDRLTSLYRWYNKYSNFSDFIDDLEKSHGSGTVHRIMPQVEYIIKNDVHKKYGVMMPDKILRFENLQNDFDDMLKELGLPATKIQVHNQTKKIQPFMDYYKYEEDIKFVNRYYHEDFESFGYKKINLDD